MPKPKCSCGECQRCKKREYMRRWYQRKTPQERAAWVARRDPEKVRAQDRKKTAKRKGDVKVLARRQVRNALKRGDLVRGACEMEGSDCRGRIEAHHDDYSRPLDVRWLCTHHHGDLHAGF